MWQWTDLACTVPPYISIKTSHWSLALLVSWANSSCCPNEQFDNNVTFYWIHHPFLRMEVKGHIQCRAQDADTDGLMCSRATQLVDAWFRCLSYLLFPVVTVPSCCPPLAAILYSAMTAVLIRLSYFQLLANSCCTVVCRRSFPKTYKQPEVQLLMI